MSRRTAKLSFRERVLLVVSQIPKGKIFSYKQIAVRAGSPRAYRATGNILNKNYDSKIPCHRVVRSDGQLGGYNRGIGRKRELLEREKNLVLRVSHKNQEIITS